MAEFKTKNTFKTLKFDEIFNFLEENGTEEQKKEFAKNCFTKYVRTANGEKNYDSNGVAKTEPSKKLNFIYAKEKFCLEFAPDLIPEKKEKEEKPRLSDKLSSWL